MEKNTDKPSGSYNIDQGYVLKEIIGVFMGVGLICLGIYGFGWFLTFIFKSDGDPVPPSLWPILFLVMGILAVLIIPLSIVWAIFYQKNFSYEISEKFIKIRYGVISRTKTTIPFSRIQNIAIHQNLRDRMLNMYTVKIETAGASAATQSAQKGAVRPEGYIPAVKDPSHLEALIDQLVHKYTQNVPENVRKNVFLDSNVAFDEFIAYFLSKMREKDQIKTTIRNLRESVEMSVEVLAERLGVNRSTVKYLEAGEYVPSLTLAMKIADVFGVRIEEIFELM